MDSNAINAQVIDKTTMRQRGKFITVEGIDGAGKSMIAGMVKDALEKHDIPVVSTREVGGTDLGETIRELLLKSSDAIGSDAETLLIFAARAQHIEEVINPRLVEGKWIVCDRFTDSTYAYQGGGRKIPFKRIELLENWAQGDLRPDLTIVADTDIRTGKSRLGDQRQPDRFESEYFAASGFFSRVRHAYQTFAKNNPDRYKLIDSGQMLEDVRSQVIGMISDFLSTHGY